MDSFAYLCDVERGGKTVTAVGLQRVLLGNFLWLAANEGIRPDIKAYAEYMLERLISITPENENEVQQHIFYRAVSVCSPRLECYQSEVKKLATSCRKKLRTELPNEAGKVTCLRSG
jgi:beta-galactosidase GanA